MTILDRGSLNPQDISTRISPKAIMLTGGDTALYFNGFERPIQVTIIQKCSPGFYETVCMITPPQAELSPRMKVQNIESYRLFTVDMSLSDTAKPREEAQPGMAFKSITNWGPKTPWNTTCDTMYDTTATNPASPQARRTATKSDPHLEGGNMEVTELAKSWAANATVEEKREALPAERHTAVIPKKKRRRRAPKEKILIIWRDVTIPCIYSDRLTPATLIEDIGRSSRATPEALVMATLTPPNNLLGTMLLDTPLSQQGIVKGDTLRMLVRHAQIHDPYDVQHLVAYRAEDTMQYFLTALREISSIPILSEIVICHKGLRLDPASRFQDCNLPHEPTLHVRFSSDLDAHPRNEPEKPEPVGEADDLAVDPTNTSPPNDRCRETQQETRDMGKARGDMGMALSMSPSQAFVQDPKGKTHVLLFNPQDSIAKNLMRHSSQLHLPPLMELYILSGSHIIQADHTGIENGFHQEPHLKILLRCRGGVRGGPRGPPQGGSGGKGRGQPCAGATCSAREGCLRH